MNYISAKEASERWKISGSRVRKLASDGRIKGAQFVGNSWMIPENSEKPSDGRTKQLSFSDTNYRFPLTIFGNYSKEEIKHFSPDERKLYQAQVFYCRCYMKKAKKELEDLVKKTTSISVKIGAYYFLCFTYMHTNEFSRVNESLFSLRLLFESNFENKNELRFILEDLQSVFDTPKINAIPLKLNCLFSYSCEAQVFLLLMETCRELTVSWLNQTHINTNMFELICQKFELENYDVAAMYMHHYIGTMYQNNKNIELAKNHFKSAIMLAIKTKCFAPLLGLSYANFEIYESVLVDCFEDEMKQAKKYHKIFQNDYAAFLKQSGVETYHQNLTDEDYKFINYVIVGLPNKKIAEVEKLSESYISKKLVSIYEKLQVSGKKELYNLVQSTIHKN